VAITLYYAPHTRAARVAFLLEELGVAYERKTLSLSTGDNKQPAYLTVHPHGLVPALRDGDVVIFETAAICMYLADRFSERRLAPAPGTAERAAYYQWVPTSGSSGAALIASVTRPCWLRPSNGFAIPQRCSPPHSTRRTWLQASSARPMC
jgi:glutathione S-transferase